MPRFCKVDVPPPPPVVEAVCDQLHQLIHVPNTWHTELQGRVCDAALQLHGGAGYMNEYMIARLWRDARVTRIFGGTSEIMKEVISRSI